ncbi:MAG: hypothetical protein E6F94_05610 [Actinobacteria bacterium]|nr:MAG: hypothetical protein E6F94_05610 [Actinomycetota bacterium]
MNTMASTRSSAGLARWAALGGILYVVLFIAGTILLFSGEPDSDASPAKVIAYYSDSGHRDRIQIGWLVAGLGIFFFLWFLSSLRRTVRRHEGEDGFLTALTTIGGVVYATLAFAAIAVNVGIRTMSDDTYHHTVFPGLIHAADDAGYVLHATGGAGASAMIIAASLAFLRSGVIRPWAGWLGVAAGILALASIAFFPQAAIALWILVVSGLLFARSARDVPTHTGAVAP